MMCRQVWDWRDKWKVMRTWPGNWQDERIGRLEGVSRGGGNIRATAPPASGAIKEGGYGTEKKSFDLVFAYIKTPAK